jgi:hypothetical protein
LFPLFATSAIDTSGAPDLQTSPGIFKKTVLMGYSGAGGKLIHEKKPEAKNLVTLSLKATPLAF